MKLFIYATLLLPMLSLTSCATIYALEFHKAIANHEAIADSIKLGDRIESVLPKLNEAMLGLTKRKIPDQYIKDGVQVEIHYARSAWLSDGLMTDDEFTPYVFNDGKLVAIGWHVLGGIKSQGQVKPETNITIKNNVTY